MEPASHREVRRYPAGLVEPALVIEAAGRCGMKARETQGLSLQFRCPMNLWSFGETVDVALGDVEGLRLVDVKSRCVLPTQIADWGKNEKNVRRLFEAIDKLLGGHVAFEPIPTCRRCGYLLVGLVGSMCPECGRPYSEGTVGGKRNEGPTLRTGYAIALILTILEVAVVLGLRVLGIFPPVLWIWGGLLWIVFVAAINFSVISVLIVLNRWVVRWRRR